MKYLTIKSLDKKSGISSAKIPVYISLKKYADSNKSLLDNIVSEFEICNFDEPVPFILKMLELGKFRILLDGLDEITKVSQNRVLSEITDFENKYSKNQFVLSCRTAAYYRHSQTFVNFSDVEIADFNEKQIAQFIKNWFNNESEIFNSCIEKINNHKSIKELSSVPLLLTLICIYYEFNFDLPENKAELYEKAISELLSQWDGRRQIIRDKEDFGGLEFRQKISLLNFIAATTFDKEKYFWSEREICELISEKLSNVFINSGKHTPIAINVLKAIEEQHGIIIEREQSVYSFSHLTIHEFFTAKYIYDYSLEGSLNNLVEKYLYDVRWKEVFNMVAGLCLEGTAFSFLLLIEKKINDLAKTQESIHKFLTLSPEELRELYPNHMQVSKKLIENLQYPNLASTRVNCIKKAKLIKEKRYTLRIRYKLEKGYDAYYLDSSNIKDFENYLIGLEVFKSCFEISESILKVSDISKIRENLILQI